MTTNPLTAAAANADMKWAFPEMKNPTIIDLSKTGGQDWWQFRPDEDVIFIGATSTRTTNKLQTDGGHNIIVLGGDYQPTYDSKGATMHFLNLYGSVHVEGVHIDSKNASQDGIAVGGASGHQPDVTVQNSLIENIHGTQGGVHGDGFQTHGSVGNMHFYNVSMSTNYQGFFISPQYNPPHKSADFENVNVKYIPGGQGISYEYWFLDSKNQSAYPITLKNVYATERSGQTAQEASVWPKASLGDSTHAVRSGNEISWPGLPYTGHITVGNPSADFATSAKTGLNWHYTGGIVGATIPASGAPAPAPAPSPEPAPAPGPAPAPVPSTDLKAPADSPAPTKWISSTDATKAVVGTDGNDQLAGVQGKDDSNLAGGKGHDTYIVDQPGDHVVEAAGQGTDIVLSYSTGYTLPANVENLVLGGTAAVNGAGNELANKITGNAAANVIDGGKGDDWLVGNGGADTFVIHKGDGKDTIADFVATGTGHDVVQLEGFGFTGFDQVKAAMVQKTGAVQIDLGNGQVLNLAGVTTDKLTAEDFKLTGSVLPPTPAPQPQPQPATPAAVFKELQLDLDKLFAAVDTSQQKALVTHIQGLEDQLTHLLAPQPATAAGAAMAPVDAHHVAATVDYWHH